MTPIDKRPNLKEGQSAGSRGRELAQPDDLDP